MSGKKLPLRFFFCPLDLFYKKIQYYYYCTCIFLKEIKAQLIGFESTIVESLAPIRNLTRVSTINREKKYIFTLFILFLMTLQFVCLFFIVSTGNRKD